MPADAPCWEVATSDTSSAVMAKKRASLIVSPLTPAPPTTAPPPDLPSDMGRRGSFYAASPASDLQADVSRRTTFYERKFQVRNVWPRRRPPRTFNATSLQKERQREADELRHAEQVKEQAASLEKAFTADANALAAKQARLEETAEQVRVQSAAVDSRASVLNADRARLDVEMAHAREETEKVACVGRPASWPSLTGPLAPQIRMQATRLSKSEDALRQREIAVQNTEASLVRRADDLAHRQAQVRRASPPVHALWLHSDSLVRSTAGGARARPRREGGCVAGRPVQDCHRCQRLEGPDAARGGVRRRARRVRNVGQGACGSRAGTRRAEGRAGRGRRRARALETAVPDRIGTVVGRASVHPPPAA